MSNANGNSNLKKLSIEKKTIRELTNEEVDAVNGGLTPALAASSMVCVDAAVILISVAFC